MRYSRSKPSERFKRQRKENLQTPLRWTGGRLGGVGLAPRMLFFSGFGVRGTVGGAHLYPRALQPLRFGGNLNKNDVVWGRQGEKEE